MGERVGGVIEVFGFSDGKNGVLFIERGKTGGGVDFGGKLGFERLLRCMCEWRLRFS